MYKLKILVCDDMEHVRATHCHYLQKLGKSNSFYPITEVASQPREALAAVKRAVLEGSTFDLAFLDVNYRSFPGDDNLDGFWIANEIHRISPATVIVMISSFSGEDNLAIAEGSPWIERFLRRDSFSQAELLSCCTFALSQKLHREETLLPQEDVIYSKSPIMSDFLKLADRISPTQNVVIYGETGTGKELTAKRINSNAKIALSQVVRPLVTINCGGLTPSLITSELFGYVKGAFTGANSDTPGLLEKAENGDVFLDELQNASTQLQDILMRVLNDKEFTPVGGKRSRKLNVRFITALNRSPSEARKSGALKPDLVARLQQGYLVIPALKDRKGDIPALIERFGRLEGQLDKQFSLEAVQFLEQSHWPTNVRGLRNVVRAAIHSSKIPTITLDSIKRMPLVMEIVEVSNQLENPTIDESSLSTEVGALFRKWMAGSSSIDEPIKEFEKMVFCGLWEKSRSIAKIARRVKLPETSVRRKLTEFGIALQNARD